MAPETLNGVLSTSKVDMWALGVILYQLITNKLPFESSDYDETLRLIRESEPPSLPSETSPILQKLIVRLLDKDPLNRPDAQELLEKTAEIRPFVEKIISDISNSDKLAGLIIERFPVIPKPISIKIFREESKC